MNVTSIIAVVTALGIAAQWLAWKLRMPAIVLLTVAGVLAGPVLGWIRPSEDLGPFLPAIVKLGVAIILLEGGLLLRFHELKAAASGVKRLVTVGVALSLLMGSWAAHHVAGLDWPVALVFGAIISITGPTVIIPILRQARLKKRPASYLKWEGIINDPTGALLAVVLFEYFIYAEGEALSQILTRLGGVLLTGGVLGTGAGYLLGVVYRRGYVPENLKGPAALVSALGVYVLANRVMDELGLMAVTIMGIVIGNMGLRSIVEIRRFKEYIAIVLVSSVFVLLTADLDPAILLRLDWRGVLLLLSLLFVVRPASVFLSTVGAGIPLRERTLIAWIAPRGIVAAAIAGVFGPRLEEHGYAGAELLLPLVFSLILITVVVHGFSIGWLSRWLGLSAAKRNGVLIVGSSPWSAGLAQALIDRKVPVMIADASWHRLRAARLAGIPVFYGQVLSELSEETLEFGEVAYLFAATDNDAYNSLVCSHFASDLGRNAIFQLPYLAPEESEARRLGGAFLGLIAPSESAMYEDLLANTYRGWTFQKTPLTEVFTYDHCLATLPEGSIPVVVVKENGLIQINSHEHPIKPKPGEMIIWFGPKHEKPKPAKGVTEEEKEAQPEGAEKSG